MPATRLTTSSSATILAASGTPETAPPVQWYRRLKQTDAFVDDTAQVFLGMRLQCAKCHHHPFEKWSQDDYYGFAAFFCADRPQAVDSPAQRSGRDGEDDLHRAIPAPSTHPKTGQTMTPEGPGRAASSGPGGRRPAAEAGRLDGRPQESLLRQGGRQPLLGPLLRPRSGRADGRHATTNPPSNPELLDGLSPPISSRAAIDLKHLIRTICTSRTYGLSSVPNEYNAKDKQSFARHYPRRMSAEVLLDAISQVTGVPTASPALPAGTRAIELPDESVASTFLDTFGRPKRDTACECERVSDASLGQSLMLLNSAEVQAKLATGGGRAEQLVKDPRPDAEKIDELFWSAFGRRRLERRDATAPSTTSPRTPQRKRGFRRHPLGVDQRQGISVQRLTRSTGLSNGRLPKASDDGFCSTWEPLR